MKSLRPSATGAGGALTACGGSGKPSGAARAGSIRFPASAMASASPAFVQTAIPRLFVPARAAGTNVPLDRASALMRGIEKKAKPLGFASQGYFTAAASYFFSSVVVVVVLELLLGGADEEDELEVSGGVALDDGAPPLVPVPVPAPVVPPALVPPVPVSLPGVEGDVVVVVELLLELGAGEVVLLGGGEVVVVVVEDEEEGVCSFLPHAAREVARTPATMATASGFRMRGSVCFISPPKTMFEKKSMGNAQDGFYLE